MVVSLKRTITKLQLNVQDTGSKQIFRKQNLTAYRNVCLLSFMSFMETLSLTFVTFRSNLEELLYFKQAHRYHTFSLHAKHLQLGKVLCLMPVVLS